MADRTLAMSVIQNCRRTDADEEQRSNVWRTEIGGPKALLIFIPVCPWLSLWKVCVIVRLLISIKLQHLGEAEPTTPPRERLKVHFHCLKKK